MFIANSYSLEQLFYGIIKQIMNSNAREDSKELDRHQYKVLLLLSGVQAILH